MTDPFLLDQKEVEVTLKRLEDAANVWRQMQRERRSAYSDSLEYEFQGVESSIRNGIRDVKWSLEDLEETLKLMSENRGHFMDSDDLKIRRGFLESARTTLADIEFEVSSPPLQAVVDQQQQATSTNYANEEPANQSAASISLRSLSEEAVELLRADSDEQVVFSKASTIIHEQKPQPQKHQPVATMVSLNLDTVRDLMEPRGRWRSARTLLDTMIRYRCWIFLALLVVFFLILIIMKAATRGHNLAMEDATTTMTTTTKCNFWNNFDCME